MKSLEWLAGILEGEGCFSAADSGSSGKYKTPCVSLIMTDGDVVDEVNKLFFVIGGRDLNVGRRKLKSGKTAYCLYLTGLPAVKVMYAVLPFMGHRRSEKILAILTAWEPFKYKEAVAFKNVLVGEEYGVKQG